MRNLPSIALVVTLGGAAMAKVWERVMFHVVTVFYNTDDHAHGVDVDLGSNTVTTLHTASPPCSQACGPLASLPPNSTMSPCCDHSHQMWIDPLEGPAPPPFLLGSPNQPTNSLPVLSFAIVITAGVAPPKCNSIGKRGYREKAGTVDLAGPFTLGTL